MEVWTVFEETRGTEDLENYKVKVELVKNTKGYGWEVTAHGASPEEALELVTTTEEAVKKRYGDLE